MIFNYQQSNPEKTTSTSGGTRTHTPQRIPDFESGASTNSATEAKEKGERKQTRATTTRPQCAQPAGHTHTSRTIGQPNPRARTLSTGPPRPAQLTHQHREHPGANTQAPPAHTQRTTNAATHPSVTAPAAASTPAMFPLPGRRSRT